MSHDAQEIKRLLGDQAMTMILNDYARQVTKKNVKCWLHNDNTPSMGWVEGNNTFHCFGGCGGYDIFDHYQEYKGLSFPEALEQLASIVNYKLTEKYEPPKIQRKTYVAVKPEYNEKVAQIKYTEDSCDEYLNRKNIFPDVAKKRYWVASSDREIFFKHFEVVNNQWVECFSKRRLLSGDDFEYTDKDTGELIKSKEISVAGGQQCFFGLQSLFDDKGAMKPYAIITEGHTDCLRTASACVEEGIYDIYSVLSVPNGSQSLKTAIENSPTFNRWFKKCKYIIIVPDADEAGRKFMESAKEFLPSNKVKWCNLEKLNGVSKGTDISDILNAGDSLESILEIQDFIPIDQCHNARDIPVSKIKHGFWTGFATADWNDSGLKDGNLTLLTGFRGQGKTTAARQIVMCAALQGVKSLCWFGEGNISQEVGRFARMCADKGEIESYDNGIGRTLFAPGDEAVRKFRQEYSDYIIFYEKEGDGNTFDNLHSLMIQQAVRGVKLFMLDNLMVMTNAIGNGVFQEQERIIGALKKFAKDYRVHVILVAHPKKGEGYQSVSGSAAIENTADTILRYVRLKQDQVEVMTSCTLDFPENERRNISAALLNEKVRDEGEDNPVFFEWDKYRGIVRDVVYIEELKGTADKYLRNGWFSRPAQRVNIQGLREF